MTWQEHVRIIKEQIAALSEERHIAERACWVYHSDLEADVASLEQALRERDSMKEERNGTDV